MIPRLAPLLHAPRTIHGFSWFEIACTACVFLFVVTLWHFYRISGD
jgi:uncharacterized membrane protein YhdT